jgi:TolA-binding protein
MSKLAKPCRLVATWLFCGGLCACATREDVRSVQEDIHATKTMLEQNLGEVRSKQTNVETGQADIYSVVQNLNTNLEALKAEAQNNKQLASSLSGKLDDLQASLSTRLDALYELLAGSKFVGSPAPTTLFNLAMSDMARSRYDAAIEGFRRYTERYPDGEKIPEAVLRIGECDARLKRWSDAIAHFDGFISNYPNNSLVASAYYQKAQALEETKEVQKAVKIYEVIVKKYPYRSEAQLAQDRLKALQAASVQPSGHH